MTTIPYRMTFATGTEQPFYEAAFALIERVVDPRSLAALTAFQSQVSTGRYNPELCFAERTPMAIAKLRQALDGLDLRLRVLADLHRLPRIEDPCSEAPSSPVTAATSTTWSDRSGRAVLIRVDGADHCVSQAALHSPSDPSAPMGASSQEAVAPDGPRPPQAWSCPPAAAAPWRPRAVASGISERLPWRKDYSRSESLSSGGAKRVAAAASAQGRSRSSSK